MMEGAPIQSEIQTLEPALVVKKPVVTEEPSKVEEPVVVKEPLKVEEFLVPAVGLETLVLVRRPKVLVVALWLYNVHIWYTWMSVSTNLQEAGSI